MNVAAVWDGQENCVKANVLREDLVRTANWSACARMEGFVIQSRVAVDVPPGIMVMLASMHVRLVVMVLHVKRSVIVQMARDVTPKPVLAFVVLVGLAKIAERVAQPVAMVTAVFITVSALELYVIT